MENILKVILLNKDGNPENVFIFNSADDNTNNDSFLFSENEQLYLDKYKPNIIKSNQKIFNDDSIRNIKRKIIKEVGIDNISYEELYLFAKKKIDFQFPIVYDYLKTKEGFIDKTVLGQLLMNLHLTNEEDGIKNLNNMNKNTYSYKDIENELNLHQKHILCNIPIGHKFSNFNDFLFSANPYDILPGSKLAYTMNVDNMLFTFENHLLLSYGTVENNTLYLCNAKNVLQHFNVKSLDEKKNIQYYFPLLSKKEIFTLEDLENQKQILINDTKNMFETMSDVKIETLYKIHNQDTTIPYIEKGITNFIMTLHPSTKTIIPLENIFKQLHTNETMPFMKYKPGFKKEELYRLHSIGISNNGKKIPYLSKTQINIFSKKIPGAHKHISFCKVKEFMDEELYIFFGLDNYGDMIVDISLTTSVDINTIENLVTDILNPLIDDINPFLSLNKRINKVKDFNDNRIEFNKIDYITSIQAPAFINNKDFNMFTTVFNIVELSNNKTILRYKRVENYKEMNEINSLINKLYKQNTNMNTIVGLISVNFSLSEEEARLHITKYLNEYTLLNGVYVNKSVDVADNPGFSTIVLYNDIENKLTIQMNDIDSIFYIHNINIYIDALLKASITKTTEINEISKILKKVTVKEKEDTTTENVITIETDELKNFKPTARGIIEELREHDDEDEEGIFFEEEDDEEEEEVEGDIINEDSISSDNQSEKSAINTENSEDENEDEEEDSIELFKGGAKDKASGTYFYNKLKKLEPTFFREDMEGEYAKICPATSNRQPVILTEEEKKEIDNDKQASSAYGIAIKYGTNPDKPYWYMCPRYWCLKTNKPMTEEQVKNGECGGKIIPQNKRSKAPEGHYIYEFTDDRQHKDTEGNYVYYNPGFLDKAKSSDNIGVPCCFRNPFSVKQNTRRQELNITDDNIQYGNETLITGEKSDKTKTTRNYLNILSIERTPIPQHRWGFLPISVELFLHTDNNLAVEKSNPTYIRKGETPLLRYGVEKSNKQSFIACIADVYTFHHDVDVPSIKKMRKIISDSISLDLYLKVHNGSLVSLFQSKRVNVSDINVEKYKNSTFYKSIDLSNSSQNNFLKFTIASYEQFLQFLDDDDSIIDHTILWDIISTPNKLLFESGVNLVIMEIMDNDIRDNISLICPTNSYSGKLYDINKGTIMLLKHNQYYEPIYIYGNTRNERASNKLNAIKVFYNENTPPNLTPIMKNIENSISNYCKPSEKPKTYIYKNNLIASNLAEIIKSIGFTIHTQVLNYRGKSIGFLLYEVKENKKYIYIPSSPSSRLDNIKHTYIDEVEWLDYDTTLSMLNNIYEKSDEKILCKPIVKVEEDGLVVGIITETNQFIPINQPEQNIKEDGLKTVVTSGYSNYYAADTIITTKYQEDDIRKNTIRNIKLETKFYRQFREKLRDEISNLMNKDYVDQLEKICDSQQYIYSVKLEKVLELIKVILGSTVNFVELPEDVLEHLNINNELNDNKNGICLLKENQICVSKNNLITGQDNEVLYFTRISDEIIRYTRVKQYLFDPSYLKLENLNYDLYSNEMLLLNTHVTGDYFDDLSYKLSNKYIENIPYEFAQPMDAKKTKKNVSLNQQSGDIDISTIANFEKECVTERSSIKKKNNWKSIFTEEHSEIFLKNTPLCSYYILSHILKKHANIEENIHGMKKLLYKAYEELMKVYILMPSIHVILAKQFKREFIEKIRKNQLSFETMIMNDNYVITQIDLWVICNHLDLPVILFSKDTYRTLKLDTSYILMGGNIETDEYTFIRSNPYKTSDSYAPNFSYIDKTIKISNIPNVVFIKRSLQEHLKNYKLNLRIKK